MRSSNKEAAATGSCQIFHLTTTSAPHSHLLPLKRNLNSLLPQSNARRSLLSANSRTLILVLHERNPLPSRHHTNFLESWKPAEDRADVIPAVVFRQVSQEQGLARRKVLVGYCACAGGCSFGGLGGSFGEVLCCGAFRGFLVGGGFEGLFALCV